MVTTCNNEEIVAGRWTIETARLDLKEISIPAADDVHIPIDDQNPAIPRRGPDIPLILELPLLLGATLPTFKLKHKSEIRIPVWLTVTETDNVATGILQRQNRIKT